MPIETRKPIISSKLKRRVLEKVSSKQKLKMGTHTIAFLILSYYAYMKNLSKNASLNALMENKRGISSEHLKEAHKNILKQTKVKRKQRTLDEMLTKRARSYRKK